MTICLRNLWLAILFSLITVCVSAQDKTPGAPAQGAQAAPAKPQFNWKKGPLDVPLLDQAVLKLPQDYGYLADEDARRFLRELGNPNVNEVIGVIVGRDSNWFIAVNFNKAGYIKDDDAKDWKADELLESIKSGTEASNKVRAQQGTPEMEIIGWAEKPHYDASQHRLMWAISSKDKGSAANVEQGINYNTYALGRDGFFTLNLVTALKDIDHDKPHAATLLSALEYKNGKKYTDFNASTDNVAAYGLTALVAGVAAKKLGLLALAAAFFAKFAKLIILGAVGVFAVIAKFFKRN